MDAEFLKLRYGLMQVLCAGAPMPAGPRQNAGHLLKRQCLHIVIEMCGVGLRDQCANQALCALHINPPHTFQCFVTADFPLQQEVKL